MPKNDDCVTFRPRRKLTVVNILFNTKNCVIDNNEVRKWRVMSPIEPMIPLTRINI